MTIRITYVQDGRKKTVTIDGSTTQDAVRWMLQNVPGCYVFRASVMKARRRPPRSSFWARETYAERLMVAADETGTGAHRPVRR